MRIVAMGGGGFSDDDPLLDRFVLSLARRERPRVCFVATASGDAADYVARFHAAFAEHDCEHRHLPLFSRAAADLREVVLAQDVVYVGGGNTANLLAVWRAHGLDAILREAWAAGVLLAGISAGMNCWFEASVTDSFGVGRADPLNDGLGLLAGSACPHYHGEPARRPAFLRLVADGALPPGHAADDGAALVFEGTDFREAVASAAGAGAYRVARDGERALPVRAL